jgi:FMN phosphatase YigB (HAD superfamily)
VLRAVLVDVGGTLWPNRLSVQLSDDDCVSQLARLLPTLEPTRALAALRSALRESVTALEQNTHAELSRAVQRLGVGCGDADAVAIRRALCLPVAPAIALFPGAVDFLQIIRDCELRCVVLSNVQVRGSAEYWRDFADLGVAHLIDAVVTSLDVGYRKPHPAMFEAAVRDAGCSARMCIMVGDSEVNDVEPAVALGMRAIRVAIEEPAPAASAAHAVATSLSETGATIKSWLRQRSALERPPPMS